MTASLGNGQLAGAEPWVSDGTVAGTRLCLDIQPGGFGSNPSEFVACGDGVLFVCKGTVNGELWSSDGTAAGTTHVCTLDPGGNASPKGLVTCRGRVFMNAYSPSVGRELHGIAMPGATQTQLGGSTGPDHPRLATVDDAQPVLGSTVDLVAHGPSGSLAVLFADRAAPPIPVLASPGLIGSGADHVGLQTGSAIFLASAVASSFVVPFALPSDPSFEGVMLDFQALWFDGAANPMLQASDGMRLTLGAARPH